MKDSGLSLVKWRHCANDSLMATTGAGNPNLNFTCTACTKKTDLQENWLIYKLCMRCTILQYSYCILFYLLVTYLSKSSMKLVQEFLTISIIKIFFGYSSHVVKWEKLELGFNESVFWAFSWHNISKIKALFNSHASIHTSSKEAGKHKQNKDLKGNVKTDRIILWNSVYLQCNLM